MGLATLARKRTPDRARETTAAMALDLSDEDSRIYLQSALSYSRTTSAAAWKWFEKLGTVHKAVSRSARIAGYARLRCVQVNPDGTDGDEVKDGLAADVVAGIYSPYSGTRGFIDRFYSLMKVPADSYLIRIRDEAGTPDGYHLLSSDEVDQESTDISMLSTRGGPLLWNSLPTSAGGVTPLLHHEVALSDAIGRVWLPGRRWVDAPDSTLAALQVECEILYTLTLALKGKIRSRFALAGLGYIPSEISTVIAGNGQRTDVLDYLDKAFRSNVTNYETAEVTVPILLRGPGANAEQLRFINIDRDLLEADLKLRAQLIDEILFGLDIQTGAVKGSENANHWGAWAMSDEEVRIAVQPDLDILCWALTRLILHPALEDAGSPPDQIMNLRVAWDVSESAVRTNRQEDIRQANELMIANPEAVMRTSGLTDGDRMTERDEIEFFARKTGNFRLMDPTFTDWATVDWPAVLEFQKGKSGPDPETVTEDSSVGPGVGDPGSPGGGDADNDEKPE